MGRVKGIGGKLRVNFIGEDGAKIERKKNQMFVFFYFSFKFSEVHKIKLTSLEICCYGQKLEGLRGYLWVIWGIFGGKVQVKIRGNANLRIFFPNECQVAQSQ